MQGVFFTGFSKRKNSVKTPGGGVNINITLKEPTSTFSPVFIIKNTGVIYNYFKAFNRYFYITDFKYITNDLIEITGTIDVMATYKLTILETSYFIKYSSFVYNNDLVDTRFSQNPEVEVIKSEAKLFVGMTRIDSVRQDGTYILTYATADGDGIVWLTYNQLKKVISTSCSEDFSKYLEGFAKQIGGADQSIRNCKLVPFSNWTIPPLASQVGVMLGSYRPSTGINGSSMNTTIITNRAQIKIPWRFSDFRNQNPFTTMYLYLPSYGYLELNPNDWIGKTVIDVTASVDVFTGDCTYQIGSIAKCDTNFSVDVPIGVISGSNQSVAGIIGSATALAGGIASSNPLATIAGGAGLIEGIVNMGQRNVGNVGGTTTGMSALGSKGAEAGNIELTLLTTDTTIDPNSILATNGRLLNQVLTGYGVSGFNQTVNASVPTESEEHSSQINQILDGGFFIE